MTGTIFDIKRFAVHDGPGIRTTVFLKGCPLSCIWCHNPEGINPLPEESSSIRKIGERVFTENETTGREISCDELMKELLKEKIFMEESGGGVTFSGGEPLFQLHFLREMLIRCREEGMHTAVDTSGYAPWKEIKGVLPWIDLFLFDVKMAGMEMYKKYTGVSGKVILKNLHLLSAEKKEIRIRIPVIPGINHPEGISPIADLLDTLPHPVSGIDLLPFHNTASHKYRRLERTNRLADLPSMDKGELEETKQRLEKRGYQVKIGG